MKRRNFLGFAGLPLLPVSAWVGRAQAGDNPPTPSQMEGPFYPLEPILGNGDLVLDADKVGGDILELRGRVVDRRGQAQSGVTVEIWQSDYQGIYDHPDQDEEQRVRHDPYFRGVGAQVTDTDGSYEFRTIRPVKYSFRPPHIHVKLWRGGDEVLTSQLYLQGQTGFEWSGKWLSSLMDFSREHLLIQPVRASDADPYQATFTFII